MKLSLIFWLSSAQINLSANLIICQFPQISKINQFLKKAMMLSHWTEAINKVPIQIGNIALKYNSFNFFCPSRNHFWSRIFLKFHCYILHSDKYIFLCDGQTIHEFRDPEAGPVYPYRAPRAHNSTRNVITRSSLITLE